MPRLIEVAISVFAQCICVLGILIGLGFVTPLLKYASSAIQGQPWHGGELARREILPGPQKVQNPPGSRAVRHCMTRGATGASR